MKLASYFTPPKTSTRKCEEMAPISSEENKQSTSTSEEDKQSTSEEDKQSTSEEDKQSTSEEEKQSTPTSDLFSFKKKQNTPSELKESLLNYQETSCYQQAPSQPPCLKLVDADEISYVKEPTILEESVSENSTG